MTTESLAGGSIQRTELGEADDTGSIDPTRQAPAERTEGRTCIDPDKC